MIVLFWLTRTCLCGAQMEAAATVQAELRRVVEENLRLRGMLEELTRSYGALYHQLLQVTQQQQHPHRHTDLAMINDRSPLTQVSTRSHKHISRHMHLSLILSRSLIC